ncbi:MAG: hypothetical protein IVW56_07165 [Candidatus Binataceae bacterium]|nr:hypothetical protein [Candidatus Binataceae bacterium]
MGNAMMFTRKETAITTLMATALLMATSLSAWAQPPSIGSPLFAAAAVELPGYSGTDMLCIELGPDAPTRGAADISPSASPNFPNGTPYYKKMDYEVDVENHQLTIVQVYGPDLAPNRVDMRVSYSEPRQVGPCAPRGRATLVAIQAIATPLVQTAPDVSPNRYGTEAERKADQESGYDYYARAHPNQPRFKGSDLDPLHGPGAMVPSGNRCDNFAGPAYRACQAGDTDAAHRLSNGGALPADHRY